MTSLPLPYANAAAIQRKIVATVDRTLGPAHEQSFVDRIKLIHFLLKARPPEVPEAERLTREEVHRQIGLHGTDHLNTATAMQYHADILEIFKGDHAAAEPLYRAVLQVRKKLLPKNHAHLRITREHLTALMRKTRPARKSQTQ